LLLLFSFSFFFLHRRNGAHSVHAAEADSL
jgi:hypothetical protein